MRWSVILLVVGMVSWRCTHPSRPTSPQPLTVQEAESLAVHFYWDLPSLLSLVPYGTGRMQSQIDTACGQAFRGNLQDEDGDSVFLQANAHLDCQIREIGQEATLVGNIQLTDSSDLDPWVGFVRYAGLPQNPSGYHVEGTYQDPYVHFQYSADLNGTISSTRDSSRYVVHSAYSARIWLELIDSIDTHTLTHAWFSYTGTLKFTPLDPSWVPEYGVDGAGTLTLEGTYTAHGLRPVQLHTPDLLEVSSNCFATPPIERGTLNIIHAADTLFLTWLNCYQVVVTFRDSVVDTLEPSFMKTRLPMSLLDRVPRLPGLPSVMHFTSGSS